MVDARAVAPERVVVPSPPPPPPTLRITISAAAAARRTASAPSSGSRDGAPPGFATRVGSASGETFV